MLNKFFRVLGRCIGILMGRQRTHRPGDLTARIFDEHDRALARLAQSSNAPGLAQINRFKSSPQSVRIIGTQAAKLQTDRVEIGARRISLIADSSAQRPAPVNITVVKRETRRVVWLKVVPNSRQMVENSVVPIMTSSEFSNIIALHRLAHAANDRKTIAA